MVIGKEKKSNLKSFFLINVLFNRFNKSKKSSNMYIELWFFTEMASVSFGICY